MSLGLELLIWLLGTTLLLSPVLFVLRRRGHSWPYLVSFFVLAVYLSVVARETLVYHSLSFNEYLSTGFSTYVNLVPGSPGPNPGSSFDIEQVVINILLGVPLGFGINFLGRLQPRTVPWIALGFGFTIEFLQLMSSLVVGHPRHIADVNDLLLNAFGVGVGYMLFRVVARVYRRVTRHRRAPSSGSLGYLAAVTGRAGAGGRLR